MVCISHCEVIFLCLSLVSTSSLAYLLNPPNSRSPDFSNTRQLWPVWGGRQLFGVEKGTDLIPSDAGMNLVEIGKDLNILPPQSGITKVVMKFGGSSVSNAERVTYVAKLIKKHIDVGYKPIIVVSAMGMTTNSLLSSGDGALNDEVYIDSLRNLHIKTAQALELSAETIEVIQGILQNLENLLNGVKMIGELSPRTKDKLVSYGERLSVRIMAATLAKVQLYFSGLFNTHGPA